LNAEQEVAFIVQDQTQRGRQHKWKAVHTIDRFTAEKYSLWHVPTGALPLNAGGSQTIPDPWQGWIEQRPGADSRTPYFGPGHPAEIRLELWLRHKPYTDIERATLRTQNAWYIGNTDLFPVSGFQWIGDHYGAAPRQTWQWWQRLKVWIAENAVRIGRFEDVDEDTEELEEWSFWAFPSAFAKLRSGMAYYARGYELEDAIREAAGNSD
jgi:hypothetical protein